MPATSTRGPTTTPLPLSSDWAAPTVMTPGRSQPGNGTCRSYAPVAMTRRSPRSVRSDGRAGSRRSTAWTVHPPASTVSDQTWWLGQCRSRSRAMKPSACALSSVNVARSWCSRASVACPSGPWRQNWPPNRARGVDERDLGAGPGGLDGRGQPGRTGPDDDHVDGERGNTSTGPLRFSRAQSAQASRPVPVWVDTTIAGCGRDQAGPLVRRAVDGDQAVEADPDAAEQAARPAATPGRAPAVARRPRSAPRRRSGRRRTRPRARRIEAERRSLMPRPDEAIGSKRRRRRARSAGR